MFEFELRLESEMMAGGFHFKGKIFHQEEFLELYLFAEIILAN